MSAIAPKTLCLIHLSVNIYTALDGFPIYMVKDLNTCLFEEFMLESVNYGMPLMEAVS